MIIGTATAIVFAGGLVHNRRMYRHVMNEDRET